MEQQKNQPKTRNSIMGVIRLIRPVNGGITFLSIASMGLIAHIGSAEVPALFLAAAAGFFMTAFGNAANDYLDVEIDRINRPDRPIPSRQVTMGQALTVLVLSLALSIGLGIVLGPGEFMFLAVTAALLAGYNAVLKRIPLVGNATVALLTGAAFMFGGVAVGNVRAALYPAVFAILINILRELIKDAADIEGDVTHGVVTFPQAYGMQATTTFAMVLAGALVLGTAVPYITGEYNLSYVLIVAATVDVPIIFQMTRLRRNFSKRFFVRMSILLKYLMVLGLTAIVIGAY
jgi:geranylgeranylglycerol-phosphate geranylgeranyltransferase